VSLAKSAGGGEERILDALSKERRSGKLQVMSFAEMKEAVSALSPAERAELAEYLAALEEGMSVEEFRRMNAAIDLELNDPSPEYSIEQVEADLKSLKPGDVP
jgi:hypothetical protein